MIQVCTQPITLLYVGAIKSRSQHSAIVLLETTNRETHSACCPQRKKVQCNKPAIGSDVSHVAKEIQRAKGRRSCTDCLISLNLIFYRSSVLRLISSKVLYWYLFNVDFATLRRSKSASALWLIPVFGVIREGLHRFAQSFLIIFLNIMWLGR